MAPLLGYPPLLLDNRGMKLGAITAVASALMDKEQNIYPSGKEYSESWSLVLFNLLFISPIAYTIVTPFLSFRNLASFAENVVFPEPWSPDIKIIEGFEERLIPSASLPIS